MRKWSNVWKGLPNLYTKESISFCDKSMIMIEEVLIYIIFIVCKWWYCQSRNVSWIGNATLTGFPTAKHVIADSWINDELIYFLTNLWKATGITMTSLWAWWRLRSPASRLFTQPYKWPVTQKMFPFDDVIMVCQTFAGVLLEYEDNNTMRHTTDVIMFDAKLNGY